MKVKVPGYDKALSQYAKDSAPITEMKIGQKAADILSSPLGAKERGGQLARVVEDETALIKQAGGFSKKDLAAQMQPQNLAKLQKVIDELDIDSRFQEQAAKGMRGENLKSAVGSGVELPHILNNAVVLANNEIRKVSGGGKIRTIKELSEILLDPKRAADIMEQASVSEKNAIKFLVRAQQTGAIVSPAVMETAE
jgi:ParB-like chromosome segregation protein Spo0J